MMISLFIYSYIGITWARIVALYTLTGALIVECVKQGHHSQANALVDALQKLVRKRLARWIIDQGGWVRNFTKTTILPLFILTAVSPCKKS